MPNLKRFLPWLISLIATVLSCTSLAETPAPNAPRSPPEHISVVLDDNYPPYSFRDSNGRLQGILPDLWRLWQDKTGIKVTLTGMDWGVAQATMLRGDADVIDTLFETPERRPLYDFSKPYARLEVPIFFHNSISGINDAQSLKGFAIGVKDGDACIETLRGQGVDNLVPYPSYESMVKAAAGHELRIMCIDKPPALYFLNKFGIENEFRYTAPLSIGEFHWAVRKGDAALHRTISEGFARISDDEHQKVEQKWLGSEVDRSIIGVAAQYAIHVLLAAAAMALLLALWIFSLRHQVRGKTSELTETMRALLSARERAETTLNQLSATLEAIPDPLFEFDIDGRCVDYRATRMDLLATPPNKLIGRKIEDILPAEAAGTVLEALAEAQEKGSSYGRQICLALPGGSAWFELSAARKPVGEQELPRFILLSRDITERKRAEAEIENLAFFDPLTQLPNRRLIFDRLRQALAASQRHRNHGALLFIDLDNFKTINDTQGHKVGDLLLRETALRLQECLRTEDTLARLGGDEFVVLLEELSQQAGEAAFEAEMAGEKILRRLASTYRLENRDYSSSASIGICLFRGNAESTDELMKRADAAMYRAKTSGRNTCCFFDPQMQASLEARTHLEAELRRALPQNELELYYQPQVDRHETILSAEVLLRWKHPQRGAIPPGQFISLAEETGLIVPIGHWVLAEACSRLKQWESSPRTAHLALAVNVSARQFRQGDFVEQIGQLLRQHAINPARLKLELTESLVLDDVAGSIEKMHALKAMGISFSMDDFGTGYSSLSYLKRLPLKQLKIDQSFVRDITEDAGDAIIVQTIIGMAHNLGLEVIAEGVEQVAQKEFLLTHGCEKFQGYLFSPPLPYPEFEKLLSAATDSA